MQLNQVQEAELTWENNIKPVINNHFKTIKTQNCLTTEI